MSQFVSELQTLLNKYGNKLVVDGVDGPMTESALKIALTPASVSSGAPVTGSAPAPWLDYGKQFLGKNENDPTFSAMLSAYWKPLTGLDYTTIVGNNRAWCALFVNFLMFKTGYKGDHSAAADSFAVYGTPCDLVPGCICVWQWASGDHHVDIYAGNNQWFGGNQNNEVKYSTYDKKYLIATRMPIKAVA